MTSYYKIIASGLGTSSGAYELSLNSSALRKISLGETVNDAIKDGELKIYEFTLPKGKYHILVKGHNNSEGQYRILVREEK